MHGETGRGSINFTQSLVAASAVSESFRVHSGSEVSQTLQGAEHYRNLLYLLGPFWFSHFGHWCTGISFHLADVD